MVTVDLTVELVWNQLRGNLKNRVFTNSNELTIAILDLVKRLEKNPTLINAIFSKKK